MPQPAVTLAEAKRRIAAIEEALARGRRPHGMSGSGDGALATAAGELQMSVTTLQNSLRGIKKTHGLEVDWSLYAPRTTIPVSIPDPKLISKTSTLYDPDGEVKLQWVQEKPSEVAKRALWEEFAAGLADELPRVEPSVPPAETASHLMACYPVGDHHLGMLAWGEETGADYDLEIGERLLANATNHLISIAPSCERAAVVFLGDFMHYDSFDAVTPAHKNLLDSDGRFPKMVRVAMRSMRSAITAALGRHKSVHVIVEPGNHDPASSVWLAQFLQCIYENEPRVTVDTSPAGFHYFDFGKTLVGTHHGHKVKMKDLPIIMATDRPQEWGRTEHRYIWTGHVHHDIILELPGCRVESFGVLAAPDAFSAGRYRAKRSMKAIILHRTYGEVARHTVVPQMFEGG